MDRIDEGDFFPINTDNRIEAIKLLKKTLKEGPKYTSTLVQKMHRQEVYSGKKDCKDFIDNCVDSKNIELTKPDRRNVALTGVTEKPSERDRPIAEEILNSGVEN